MWSVLRQTTDTDFRLKFSKGLGGTCGGGTCHPGSVLDTVKVSNVDRPLCRPLD